MRNHIECWKIIVKNIVKPNRHDRRSNLDKEANEAEKQPNDLVKFTESQEISLEATPNTVVLRKIKTEMK